MWESGCGGRIRCPTAASFVWGLVSIVSPSLNRQYGSGRESRGVEGGLCGSCFTGGEEGMVEEVLSGGC